MGTKKLELSWETVRIPRGIISKKNIPGQHHPTDLENN